MPLVPSGETVTETKNCTRTGKEFVITDVDLAFYDQVSPIFAGKKYTYPTPTLCPEERQRRRCAFRNERKIYYRTCDMSGKKIVSMHSPDKPYPVYEQTLWRGDDWSPGEFARDFDFSRSFFEQIHELNLVVPKLSLACDNLENSEFNTNSGWIKDSYLLTNSNHSERCFYGKAMNHCFSCVDCHVIEESEQCYECMDVYKSYGLMYCENCVNCRDSFFIKDCIGCTDCIGCINLKNKQYCILNKQYSKEEYETKKQELLAQISSPQLHAAIEKNFLQHPVKYIHELNTEASYGDHIFNCKNAVECYQVRDSEDLKYCSDLTLNCKNCMDISYFGIDMSFLYEGCSVGLDMSNSTFCHEVWTNISDVHYSLFCFTGVNNCFGCVGLHNKEQHCILNTAYSKQEYEQLCGKIIHHMQEAGEWGEFFPEHISCYGYNESAAHDFFPLDKQEVLKRGWNWSEYEADSDYNGPWYTPLNIQQYEEGVVGRDTASKNINELTSGILKCEITGKPYRIIAQELAFYVEHGIQIPGKSPDQRFVDRLNKRNPQKLYERTCAKTGETIWTTYAPDRPETVYSAEAYRKDVYS